MKEMSWGALLIGWEVSLCIGLFIIAMPFI